MSEFRINTDDTVRNIVIKLDNASSSVLNLQRSAERLRSSLYRSRGLEIDNIINNINVIIKAYSRIQIDLIQESKTFREIYDTINSADKMAYERLLRLVMSKDGLKNILNDLEPYKHVDPAFYNMIKKAAGDKDYYATLTEYRFFKKRYLEIINDEGDCCYTQITVNDEFTKMMLVKLGYDAESIDVKPCDADGDVQVGETGKVKVDGKESSASYNALDINGKVSTSGIEITHVVRKNGETVKTKTTLSNIDLSGQVAAGLSVSVDDLIKAATEGKSLDKIFGPNIKVGVNEGFFSQEIETTSEKKTVSAFGQKLTYQTWEKASYTIGSLSAEGSASLKGIKGKAGASIAETDVEGGFIINGHKISGKAGLNFGVEFGGKLGVEGIEAEFGPASLGFEYEYKDQSYKSGSYNWLNI